MSKPQPPGKAVEFPKRLRRIIAMRSARLDGLVSLEQGVVDPLANPITKKPAMVKDFKIVDVFGRKRGGAYAGAAA